MKKNSRDVYMSGDHNLICHVCGMKIKASEARLRWDGVYTCPRDWEPRHPQEATPPVFRDPRALKVTRPARKIGDEVFVSPNEWETLVRNWEDYTTDNWEDWG